MGIFEWQTSRTSQCKYVYVLHCLWKKQSTCKFTCHSLTMIGSTVTLHAKCHSNGLKIVDWLLSQNFWRKGYWNSKSIQSNATVWVASFRRKSNYEHSLRERNFFRNLRYNLIPYSFYERETSFRSWKKFSQYLHSEDVMFA